ncbi:uncharacterized protein LOC141607325 [Silene latifolia]|uniref:uncharacterized protein LOC141607325 n=1 Tax=Silene latifolia TaxID=37657 RepID=UPI003D77FDFE
MELGMRRRIGDGRETFIWGHAWIPHTQTGQLISPCVVGYEGSRVKELLTPDGRDWDEGKLQLLLLRFERERIRSIRLSSHNTRDLWYWGLEKDGLYTVRSAYKRLVGEVGDMAGGSGWERNKWLWSRLWKFSVWPHVKLFFWQLCSEALATRANIAARVGGEFSTCSFCHSSIELSLHLFRDCGVANWVWEGLGMESVTECRGHSVKDLVEACWRDMEEEESMKLMFGCWAIWEHQNKVGFDNMDVGVDMVVRKVRDVLNEGVGDVLNVDAGVKEGEGVGTGVVCRGQRGEVLWGLSIGRTNEWEVHVAEAVTVLDGLEEAARRGIRRIELESDCLQVVKAIKGGKTGRSIFAAIIDDIIMLSSTFESVIWLHVNRINNCVAHALAHCVPRVIGRVTWEDGLPSSASAAVTFDRLSLIE